MSVTDELERLQQLRQSGGITEDEFVAAKARLLSEPPPPPPPPSPSPTSSPSSGPAGCAGASRQPALSPEQLERETRQWAMFLHLSQLAGFVVPLAGWVAPIVIWQVKKTDLPGIDVHGKIVVNWIISELIYALICFVLSFVLIGIPLLIALAVVGVVFPILGGVRANEGRVWPYPFTIAFIT